MNKIFVFLMAALAAFPAQAYVGPGAGLGAIAASLALLIGFILLIVGFVWFPIRRRMRARKAAKAEAGSQAG